jgi:RNA-binding protein
MDSKQRKKLRGLAHDLKPVVIIGQKGLTEELVSATLSALNTHELIKIKFNGCKDSKKEVSEEIAEKCGAAVAGVIGNIAILFRQNPDPEKAKIVL